VGQIEKGRATDEGEIAKAEEVVVKARKDNDTAIRIVNEERKKRGY
jgi:hypothetical protein